MLTFNRNTLPGDEPISSVLDRKFPFRNSSCNSINQSPLVKLAMPDVDISQLLADTVKAMEIHGQWNYRLGKSADEKLRLDAGYGGIGLTYNPTHNDLNEFDIHQQVQGNPKPATGMSNPFSVLDVNTRRIFSKRNSHYDTYALSYRTPASRHGYLGEFLDTCKRTMVRSAVRIIYADQEGPVGDGKYAGVTWHRDESMFENLRVNIPLLTDPIFLLEQEGYPPEHLESGYAYSWDTHVLHRAYATEKTPKHRIHLMLGFSCWWDFDEESGNWSQNEFFGKKHPKDMLIDGDVIPGLRLT
jgi:hypothetical protein